jgi:hypothetical protein
MCLRLNKNAKLVSRVKEWRKVSQMREPAGYLGVIVRRMKHRAAIQCDGVVLTFPREEMDAARAQGADAHVKLMPEH